MKKALLVFGMVTISLLITWERLFAQLPELYGVICGEPNRGALIRIDVNTGAATLIGNTNLNAPCALTYDSTRSRFLVQESFGTSGIHVVDIVTGATTPLGAPALGVRTLAYGHVDDLLYGAYNDIDFATLFKIDPVTGADLGIIGQINKGPIGGLAVRPADGRLLGFGYDGLLAQKWLFWISTSSGAIPLETEISQVDEDITGLAFWVDGTLFATNGTQLLKVSISTGTKSVIGPFGAGFGPVSGIAFKTPLVQTPVDLLIRDCRQDQGSVPSAPSPCSTWWVSPDIWIDNNGDGTEDMVIPGIANRLFARIQNSGSSAADSVLVRFYYCDSTRRLANIDDLLIGQTTISVPAHQIRRAMISWIPPASIEHHASVIGVRAEHPDDPSIIPPVSPQYDNNFAIRSFSRFRVRPGIRLTIDLGSFHEGGAGFGFREGGRNDMFRLDARLPAEWRHEARGLSLGRMAPPKPGETAVKRISVDVPNTAKPNSGGALSVLQVDVTTGQVIYGSSFVFIVDAYPPAAPQNVKAEVRPGGILLSWNPVIAESGSGKREKVSFYEVFRDEKAIAKVVGEGETETFSIQWQDKPPGAGTYSYNLRAVDEAGNTSALSTTVKAMYKKVNKRAH